MRHFIALTVILLIINGTFVTVDAFDFINVLSKGIERLLPPKNNNEKVIENLKKDNDLLKVERDNLFNLLANETEARQLAENAFKDGVELNESLNQEIGQLQLQLAGTQQQFGTCNQEQEICRSANEVLNAKVEQLKYSLEKCEQDKQDEAMKLNGEIGNVRGRLEDCENSLSSCRRDHDAFVAAVIQRQSQFTASLTSAAAESVAIESAYAAFTGLSK